MTNGGGFNPGFKDLIAALTTVGEDSAVEESTLATLQWEDTELSRILRDPPYKQGLFHNFTIKIYTPCAM